MTAHEIPFSEIARRPLPGMSYPVQVAFSHDEAALAYLYDPDGGLELRLFVVSIPGSEPRMIELGREEVAVEKLSLDEQLRRERARVLFSGVTSFSWATGADVLLVPGPNGLQVLRGLAGGGAGDRRLVVRGPTSGAKLSPDGSKVAFVREDELWVASTENIGEPIRLSVPGGEAVRHGVAEFVAQEEMERPDGLWWSPDSALIAYAEVDESPVPLYRIVHQGSEETGPETEEAHHYPFAGAANATVRVGVVPATGGETRWLEQAPLEEYLVRLYWLEGGALVCVRESRDQTRVTLSLFDAATGGREIMYEETGAPYLNLGDDFVSLSDGRFVWRSERSGFAHLELRSRSGELLAVLTEGEWLVDSIEAVDEEGGEVFFTGTMDGPTERHLYAIGLDGGVPRKLTEEAGTHHVVVAARAGVFVDQFASLTTPPVVRLCSTKDSSRVLTLHQSRDGRIDELELRPPELVSFRTEDATKLHGLVFRPEGNGPFPLVVLVYGGPHAQLCVNDWAPTVMLRPQALARRGIAVVAFDNRGSARRGLAFESALWRRLGTVEVADQVAGVRWAVASGLADPARVAVYGWSYGGYMTLRCLELAGDTFRAGVAGAPVTDFRGYDTYYTERYMGTPLDNAEGYEESSVLGRTGAIGGELLLVHGLVDENVHFRHTARLINRLVSERRPYSLLLFPEERHMPRLEEDRAYMEERMISFLCESLGAAQKS